MIISNKFQIEQSPILPPKYSVGFLDSDCSYSVGFLDSGCSIWRNMRAHPKKAGPVNE
uniref:Uncharacterized protein n=1 Tax=Setaria viridis TaxID=4556 RepID=A0A4U6U6Y9_SETVI|nr:hypothetical protein SEVIR_6G235451v2 [Setaria viridis]